MMKGQHHKSQSRSKKTTSKSPMLNIQKRIYYQFKTTYSNKEDFYNIKITNEIISNESAHIVALFKDFLIADDVSEFLQRYYQLTECHHKLPKIYEYYQSCSVIFPNYVILHEAKYICKNIQRKQRLIDNQQILEEEQERRKQDIKLLDNSVETVFHSKTFESLLNVTGGNSIILRAVGDYYVATKHHNGNPDNCNGTDYMIENDTSVNELIEHINECEVNYEKNKEKIKRKIKGSLNSISIEKITSVREKTKHYFMNNFLTTDGNSTMSKTLLDKKNTKNTNQDQVKTIKIHMPTASNELSPDDKQKIASIILTQPNNIQKKVIHKSTLSMPKLSSRIFNNTNNKPLVQTERKTEDSQPCSPQQQKPQQYLIRPNNISDKINKSNNNNNSNFIPLTSREGENKPKLNLKADLYELITCKFYKNANLSRKTIANVSTVTPSIALKQQQHSNQHQQKQQITQPSFHYNNKPSQHLTLKGITSSISQQKKRLYGNLYDKYQKKSNPPTHRNKRNTNNNEGLQKMHTGAGVLSYDFSITPITDLLKTTRQITFTNEMDMIGKRREKIVKSLRIKNFEDLLKKKENGMGYCYSDRQHDRDTKDLKPNGIITNIKYKKGS